MAATPAGKHQRASPGVAREPSVQELGERLSAQQHAVNRLQKLAAYSPDAHALRVANPAPLGLFAFGLTTALLQGAVTGWTEAGTESITYGFALAYGGFIQLLAGMWEIWRNNMFAGVAFSSYGGFWLGYALFQILVSANVLVLNAPKGLEMMLAIWAIFTFILLVASFNINLALVALFSFLTITFSLLAAGVQHPKVNKAGGYFGVATALIACVVLSSSSDASQGLSLPVRYTATAELLNEVYRRRVLPLGQLNLVTAEPEREEPRPDVL